jgi:hypothetical protein
VACLLVGLSIPLWFIGSIQWTPGARGTGQVTLLVVAYLAAAIAVVLAVNSYRHRFITRNAKPGTSAATPEPALTLSRPDSQT